MTQFLNEALTTYIQPALNDFTLNTQRENAIIVLAWVSKCVEDWVSPLESFTKLLISSPKLWS